MARARPPSLQRAAVSGCSVNVRRPVFDLRPALVPHFDNALFHKPHAAGSWLQSREFVNEKPFELDLGDIDGAALRPRPSDFRSRTKSRGLQCLAFCSGGICSGGG
jgi:hypothetical protein